MRILVLADAMPYPLSHGQHLRIFHYVRTLGERHEFDLLCLDDRPLPQPVKEIFRRIETIPPTEPARSAKRGWRERFALEEMLPEDQRITDRLQQFLTEIDYDLIWMTGERVIPSVPFRRIPVLMDLVDDNVLTLLREAKSSVPLRRRLQALKRAFMHFQLERRYYGQGDGCLVVAEPDARMFSRICPWMPVRVVKNGVDPEYFAPREGESRDPVLVFEGNMSFPPNVDAVLFFARKVLPRIRQEVPEARFLVVGKDPAEEIRRLEGPEVEVTGFVDDLRPYIRQGAVFVSPLRKGAGIKNKVLQAWAMGRPVVGTRLSFGGLQVREGENALVADGPSELAASVVRLLRDPRKRAALGREGRQTVLSHYTWDQKGRELEAVMLEVAAKDEKRSAYA
ncbi:glycosyltransferase family 4 protein [Thiohalorhabdus sp. Cl-TMA]|uniref:Glycosyltransferase family 4 protein n=1 Tax=Thiohalorhabdus methylotrophus TaxID=3242694 RepID=A0ABV4TUR4_9GAMM